MAVGELRTLTTNLPPRLDRLPWAWFHCPLPAHETDDAVPATA
jgi:hypothetical protein